MFMLYYVYTLVNSLTNVPFYVGYGHGRRMYAHKRTALRGKNPNRTNYSLGHTIRELIERGGDVIYIKEDGHTIEQAKEIEIQKIKKYGRLDLGTGSLCNLTNGGDGNVGWSKSQREKCRREKLSYSDERKKEILDKFHATLNSIDKDAKREYIQAAITGIKEAHRLGKYRQSLTKLHNDNSQRFAGKNNPLYREIDEEILVEAENLYKKGWGYLRISGYFNKIKGYKIGSALVRSKLIRRGIQPRTSNFKKKL